MAKQDAQTRRTALQLLEQCKAWGVLADDCNQDIIDIDLLDAGVLDSMSLEMLNEMLESQYGVTIPKELFVGELRSLTLLAGYLQQQGLC